MVCNGIMRMGITVYTTSCQMFCYRKMGKMDYLDKFNAVPDDSIEIWFGMKIVLLAPRVWSKAQVRVEFRYIRKQEVFWDGCDEESR